MDNSAKKCFISKHESHQCAGNGCHSKKCYEEEYEKAHKVRPTAALNTEPQFELDGKSHYGDYAPILFPPGNRHFIPRRAKLKAAGGRSISLYEKWRLMQYHTNCIMKRFLEQHAVNVSILPPCVNYDLWKHPKWKAAYDKPLDEDPCPDCDVRFSADCNGEYRAKIAPASLLVPNRWRKRKFLDTIILIGLPQHITVAYIKETASQVYVEYVDPAGPSGDRRGSEQVQMWMHRYLGPRIGKPIRFYQAAKGINFQSDKNDVMCQTWIWYWVYFRLVRKISHESMARHIYQLSVQQRSLQRVHQFNCWLADLYKLGYFISETASQTRVAIEMTPMRPSAAASSSNDRKIKKKRSGLKSLIKKTSNKAYAKLRATRDDDSDESDSSMTSVSSSASSEEFDDTSPSYSTEDMTD